MQRFAKDNIIVSWLVWHFLEMPRFLFSVWNNFISFGLDFFSVPALLVTFFSPWRRYKWKYPSTISIMGYLETFVSNVFSRIIGVILRFVLIIVGMIVIMGIILLGGIGIILWFFLPFIVISIFWFLFYV